MRSEGSIYALSVAGLCALAIWSCRDAESACNTVSCAGQSAHGGATNTVEAGAGGLAAVDEIAAAGSGADNGGSSGEAGSDQPNARSDGGAAHEISCKSDEDCADALACNGTERCAFGRCQPGTAPSCDDGMRCVEQGDRATSCAYEQAGRWLTFLASESGRYPFELRAQRLEGNRHRESISISAGIVDTNYQLLDVDSWSPDGRHLIVTNVKDFEHIEINRLFSVDFGDGLPSAPILLKDIPVGASLISGPWAKDSSAVFVENYSTMFETYLVRFSRAGVRTELLFNESSSTDSLRFCPDSRYFYRSAGGDSMLVDSLYPDQPQLLWQGSTESSPDGRWLLHSDDATGLWLATCEPGTKVVRLSETPAWLSLSWSSDGRFVAVSHYEPPGELEVLDSVQEFQSVFKGTKSDYRWAPSSPKLMLIGEQDTNRMQELTEVDLSEAPAHQLSRGSVPHPPDWGFIDDDTLWAARDESTSYGFWVLEKEARAWRRIATQFADISPVFTANNAYAVLREERNDGTTQLLAFSLHDEDPMPIPLLPAPQSGDLRRAYTLNDALLVSRFTGIEPYEGQFWWIAASTQGFAEPVLLSDVRAVVSPLLQPLP